MSRRSRYDFIEDATDSSEQKWKVAVYIRLSVEDGDKVESNSVTNQRQLLKAFLEDKKDTSIYDVYIDDGYSGTTFNRPGFQKMLKDMKEKRFNTIVVKDLSRLGRNYIEVGNYIEQIFPLFDIRFIAVNDNIDSYLDPKSINNVVVPFKNLINDEYCRDISNKIRAVLDIKKKKGEFIGSFAPYGYKKDPEDTHHLIIDIETASVVKLIFKWSLEGMGRTKIANKLNGMGIINPNGYKSKNYKKNKNVKNAKEIAYSWDSSTIFNILRNQIYCGDMVQNKGKMISYKIHKYKKNNEKDWIIVRNTHDAIIDRETFKLVQEAIISRDTRVDSNGELSTFAGHIKCYDCKRAMTKKDPGKYKGKKRDYYYYCCSTFEKKSKNLCTKHSIRNDQLEKAVFETIKMQISLVLDIERAIKEISNSSNTDYKVESYEININRLEKDVEKYKKLKKSAYEDWKCGELDEKEYFEYTGEYSKNIKDIEDKLQNLYEGIATIRNNSEEDSYWIEKFLKNKNITELNKGIIDELIDNIYVHEDGNITIVFNYQDEYEEAVRYVKENRFLLEKYI